MSTKIKGSVIPQNPNWEPVDIPKHDDLHDPRAIKEEYFCAEDPRHGWRYGLFGTLALAIIVLIVFSKDTAFDIFKYYAFFWIILFAFMAVFDHFFILYHSQQPEIGPSTTFTFIDRIYKLERQQTLNFIRYSVTSWKETLWYTKNISGNLILVDYCRLFQYAIYFTRVFLKLVDHKKLHLKASFFFVLNSSLCAFVQETTEEIVNEKTKKKELTYVTKLEFENIRVCVDNYGIKAAFFKLNLEYEEVPKVTVYLDSEKEVVSKMVVVRYIDRNCKNLNKIYTTTILPDTQDSRYEMHTALLVLNTLVAHVSSHLMAAFVTDLDAVDFPSREIAGTAISGLNTAGLYISYLVTGPISFPVVMHNLNLGYPHYPVTENRVLQEKSQIYLIMRKIFNNKELIRIVNQDKYVKKFKEEYEAERQRQQAFHRGTIVPEYDPRFEVTRSKILRSAIANNFAMHGIDHYIHDRMCPIYCYNDFFQYNNTRQAFFGGKWNCDISSNFMKPVGNISQIVYDIVKCWGGQQLIKGFQWTLEQ